MRCSAIVLVFLTLALAARTSGDQAANATPKFRSGARLVQVSIAVRDRRNRPMEGLDRDAFKIFEDGREQPVAFFIPASGSSPRANAPADRPTPDASFSNRIASPSNGGVVAIIFDQLNSSASAQMRGRQHLLQYLKSLQPGDRVALYVMGANGLRVLYDFSTDAQMLVRALDGILAGSANKMAVSPLEFPPGLLDGLTDFATGSSSSMNGALQRLRAEMTLENLQHVATHLAGVPGRKNIIWLSSGFPFVIGPGDTMSKETRQAMQTLNSVDATLYPVDLRGLIAGSGAALPTLNTIYRPLEGLLAAAEWTGGRAFFNTNGLSEAMSRAVEDSKSTYVLGYYPSNPDWNGKFRSIKIKVARSGVEVRHRAGYLADPIAPPQAGVQQTMSAALAAPLEATALSFDVSAESGVEGTVLRLKVDASGLTLTETEGHLKGEIDVAIAQMLSDRRLVPEVNATYPFSVSAADRERLLASPIQLTRTIRLAPDTSQVRVVIRDVRSGSLGSIFIDAARLRQTAR